MVYCDWYIIKVEFSIVEPSKSNVTQGSMG